MSKNPAVVYIIDEFEGVYKGVLEAHEQYDEVYRFIVIKSPKTEGMEIAEIIVDYDILPGEIEDYGSHINPELAQILYE